MDKHVNIDKSATIQTMDQNIICNAISRAAAVGTKLKAKQQLY